MTFKRSLYLSFTVHILVFGTAIAIAHYAGRVITFLPPVIQVSLVDSGSQSGRATGAARGSQHRPSEAIPQAPQPPVEQQDQVPEEVPPDLSTTSLSPADGKGTIENTASGPDGGQVISSARTVDDNNPGFGLIAPEQWAAIESAIERTKSYPRIARARGIEGVVRLRFKLNPEGSIEKIEILESSGSKILDNASVRAVYRAVPMPAVSGWVEMPMKYVLK
jgi:TonB family protein